MDKGLKDSIEELTLDINNLTVQRSELMRMINGDEATFVVVRPVMEIIDAKIATRT